MQVIFLQNTIYKSRRYRAGESAKVDEAIAKQMIEADLAYVDKEAEEKAPVKRTTRKAASK